MCQERLLTLFSNNLNKKKQGEETSNFNQKCELTPFIKMQILQLSNINVFFFVRVEKVIFYQEHCQAFFLINLAEKSEGQETSNF